MDSGQRTVPLTAVWRSTDVGRGAKTTKWVVNCAPRCVRDQPFRQLIDFDGWSVVDPFGELDEVVLAYATTIHKSQGSEYPAVVIPVVTQHATMLQRNLIYTGMTTASASSYWSVSARPSASLFVARKAGGAGRS